MIAIKIKYRKPNTYSMLKKKYVGIPISKIGPASDSSLKSSRSSDDTLFKSSRISPSSTNEPLIFLQKSDIDF
jgi:hypothetical protein